MLRQPLVERRLLLLDDVNVSLSSRARSGRSVLPNNASLPCLRGNDHGGIISDGHNRVGFRSAEADRGDSSKRAAGTQERIKGSVSDPYHLDIADEVILIHFR